jgi:hypothetical protein
MSTRLLYIILVGNLDFKWKNGKPFPTPRIPRDVEYRRHGEGQRR